MVHTRFHLYLFLLVLFLSPQFLHGRGLLFVSRLSSSQSGESTKAISLLQLTHKLGHLVIKFQGYHTFPISATQSINFVDGLLSQTLNTTNVTFTSNSFTGYLKIPRANQESLYNNSLTMRISSTSSSSSLSGLVAADSFTYFGLLTASDSSSKGIAVFSAIPSVNQTSSPEAASYFTQLKSSFLLSGLVIYDVSVNGISNVVLTKPTNSSLDTSTLLFSPPTGQLLSRPTTLDVLGSMDASKYSAVALSGNSVTLQSTLQPLTQLRRKIPRRLDSFNGNHQGFVNSLLLADATQSLIKTTTVRLESNANMTFDAIFPRPMPRKNWDLLRDLYLLITFNSSVNSVWKIQVYDWNSKSYADVGSLKGSGEYERGALHFSYLDRERFVGKNSVNFRLVCLSGRSRLDLDQFVLSAAVSSAPSYTSSRILFN